MSPRYAAPIERVGDDEQARRRRRPRPRARPTTSCGATHGANRGRRGNQVRVMTSLGTADDEVPTRLPGSPARIVSGRSSRGDFVDLDPRRAPSNTRRHRAVDEVRQPRAACADHHANERAHCGPDRPACPPRSLRRPPDTALRRPPPSPGTDPGACSRPSPSWSSTCTTSSSASSSPASTAACSITACPRTELETPAITFCRSGASRSRNAKVSSTLPSSHDRASLSRSFRFDGRK